MVSASLAQAAGWTVIARAHAAGRVAPALATGTAKRPTAIAVRVLTSRPQRAKVTAVVVCTKLSRVRSKATRLSLRSGVVRSVTLPLARPFRCDVTAVATIYHGGTIRLQVLARR
jgi:hypothetical protein